MEKIKSLMKGILRFIAFYYYRLKCRYGLIIDGFAGLALVISTVPKRYIIPLLRIYGARVGNNCDIDTGLILHRFTLPLVNLVIGDNVHLGHHTYLDLTEQIRFEQDTAVGSFSMFVTHTGDWTKDKSDEHETTGIIHVGKAVIIYSGVIITPGIIIGDYARIAANAVVLIDIPPYSFAAGVPAIIKKDRRTQVDFH
jgi:acetyltransferase-like isoleucine patch superfamily enzyme